MDRGGEDMRGIVRPSMAGRRFTLDRWDPEPPLDRFVSRFWKTAWSLDEPFCQPVVTFPTVNLVFQADGSATVTGIQRTNDNRVIEGEGWALGVMFRTAGFAPFTSRPMASLVDQRLPADEVLGDDMAPLAAEVTAAESDADRRAAVTRFLLARAPLDRTAGEDLSDLIEAAVAADPSVTTVAALSERALVSKRTLQRRFLINVGVGPKLVLDRYRLQAAGEAARQPPQSWAEVADRLGYADQAHLTTDVSKAFGSPPATYANLETAPEEEHDQEAT